MSRHHPFIAATTTAILLASHLAAQSPATPPNDTARLLAGLMPATDAALVAMTQSPAWQQHANFFDSAWANLEKSQLLKVRSWAKSRIPDAFSATTTAFYMFSGPDFLYADTFFPQASTYVLCGIEPIGPLPDVSKITPQALGGELHTLQGSLNSVLNFSFFITKDMKNDFQNHSMSGTLPILYIFLARSGKTITDVSYVSVNDQGSLTTQPDGARSPSSPAPGVCIHFLADGSDTPRTLYYFSTDLSDSGLKRSGFLNFLKTLAPANSCVKSASYLMHESYFSNIRAFLLENATTVVQDDSGIPIAYFTPDAWQLRVFGSYPGPIPLFKNCLQPKLAEYYHTTHPEPLNFGIGYRHHAGESTLMVATRQSATTPPPPPARAVIVPEPSATPPPTL